MSIPRATLGTMILLLFGDDTYRSRQRLRVLRDAFRAKYDRSGINIVRRDGETLTADTLMRLLTVQGFLTANRLVIVENFLTRGKAGEQEAVHAYLEGSNFDVPNILLLWEEAEAPVTGKGKKADSGSRLWHALAASAKTERFTPLDGAMLTRWYSATIKERGGTIEKPALHKLIELIGSDLWQASAEIDKLIHFKMDQAIIEADLAQLVATSLDEDIFAITDALGNRDRESAFRLIEQHLASGVAPLYLLRMFAWHVRNLLGARSLLDDGVSNPKTMARELGIHPFVAQKVARQAQQFRLADLRAMIGELVEVDYNMKSRSLDPRALFTLLTLKMLRPARDAVTTSGTSDPSQAH